MAGYNTDKLQKQSGAGPTAIQFWLYSAGVDVAATVRGAGYFSDGDSRGMRVGDIVVHHETATPLGSVSAVSAVTKGGAATVTA